MKSIRVRCKLNGKKQDFSEIFGFKLNTKENFFFIAKCAALSRAVCFTFDAQRI